MVSRPSRSRLDSAAARSTSGVRVPCTPYQTLVKTRTSRRSRRARATSASERPLP